jgi:E3 ubiquitin-protein ligase synoviolin
MRLAYYAGASTAAAAACLLKAFHERPNFYSATVYLSQSNACLLILTNLLLILACSFMYALQRLLYGPLRPIEIEQLSEKAWYAVLDTLLAMPSFREDVGGWLLTMFVLLLAGKVWGWIGEGRVDILEQQPPANPRLFHARLSTSLVLSVVFDVYMLSYCVEAVIADPRPGMMVIFTFEFAILTIFSLFTLCRYGLSLYEAGVVKKQTLVAIEERKTEIRAERAAARQNETEDGRPAPAALPNEAPIEVDENEVDVPGWEEKRRYLFMLEVLTDFTKLVIYIVFFTVSITFNGLPMHIMRDVYMTFASFSKRVADYIAYRKATSDMNTRYPDATTEEIRGDSCIVCRENMVTWVQPTPQADAQPAGDQPAAAPAPAQRRDEGLRAKKLPCGHILHLRCLKAWLERQQVCPTCRRPVVTAVAPEVAAAAGNNGGAQPGQPGQPGQQPPARRGRARIFNFGPLRVGLLNGPNEQMRNILNQIQNPDGAANQNNAQAGANQAGNANQAAGAGAAPAFGLRQTGRAQVPLTVQLMQVEQRIMQEAHNLQLEQQALVNLRHMEAELARLRGQIIPDQPFAPATIARRQQANGIVPSTEAQLASGSTALPTSFTHPTTFSGNATDSVPAGHESLLEGLVVPPGWSVMPLRRLGGEHPNTADSTAATVDAQSATSASSAQSNQPGVASSAANPTSTATSTSQETQPADTAAGPTDEHGSPLFVPTRTYRTSGWTPTPPPATQAIGSPAFTLPPPSTTSQPSSSQAQAQPANTAARLTDERGSPLFIPTQNGAPEPWSRSGFPATQAAQAAEAAPAAQAAPASQFAAAAQAPPGTQDPAATISTNAPTTAAPQSFSFQSQAPSTQAPSPWVPGSGTWSFTGPQAAASEQEASSSTQADPQRTPAEEESSSTDKGKGKARAVEVEEVPDPEA